MLSLHLLHSQAFLSHPITPYYAPYIGGLCSLDGEGNGNPLQHSCLENPMDGRAWWAAVHGVAKSRTQLSDFTFTFHSHALEKEMATHSSVLAWRILGIVGCHLWGRTESRYRLFATLWTLVRASFCFSL